MRRGSPVLDRREDPFNESYLEDVRTLFRSPGAFVAGILFPLGLIAGLIVVVYLLTPKPDAASGSFAPLRKPPAHFSRSFDSRAYGPEQATGEPDTHTPGDFSSAWASASPDGQDTWLLLEFPTPVVPNSVRIHETDSPGAVYRVTAFRSDGSEVLLWEGTDPTVAGKGVSQIYCAPGFQTRHVRIFIRSRSVYGRNGIDAVGLVDSLGTTHWASAAAASSTYGYGAHGSDSHAFYTKPSGASVPIGVKSGPTAPP